MQKIQPGAWGQTRQARQGSRRVNATAGKIDPIGGHLLPPRQLHQNRDIFHSLRAHGL